MVQFLVGELKSGGPHGIAQITLILIIKHYLHLREVMVAIITKFTFAILLFVFRMSTLFFILFPPRLPSFVLNIFLAYPFHSSVFAIIYTIHY